MLKIGDRIWFSGGYDMEPQWLEGKDGYSGIVFGFKEFDHGRFVIAKLDQKIKSSKLESDIILMQLRYKNAVWNDTEHVHIFLCGEIPSVEFLSKEWFSQNAVWMESHANYKKIQ